MRAEGGGSVEVLTEPEGEAYATSRTFRGSEPVESPVFVDLARRFRRHVLETREARWAARNRT